MITRRNALLSAAALLPITAFTQSFPSRPIKILIGFGPGGTTDAVARLYALKMTELLNTSVVVENKPGANNLNAIRGLQQAPADGYTLYIGSGGSLSSNPAMRGNPDYDPLKDFSHIGLAVMLPAVLFINNDLPVRTMSELVAYVRANPGKLNYGSGGVGSSGHLQVEALLSMTGMRVAHIPYKSDAEVIREVMAGTIHMALLPTLNVVSSIQAGKIRGIVVTTGRRLPFLPNVPSLPETNVPGMSELEPHSYLAFVGPVGMPASVIAKLNETINSISSMPDIAARVRDNFYAEPATSTPSSFKSFLGQEQVKWAAIGKTVKLPE